MFSAQDMINQVMSKIPSSMHSSPMSPSSPTATSSSNGVLPTESVIWRGTSSTPGKTSPSRGETFVESSQLVSSFQESSSVVHRKRGRPKGSKNNSTLKLKSPAKVQALGPPLSLLPSPFSPLHCSHIILYKGGSICRSSSGRGSKAKREKNIFA